MPEIVWFNIGFVKFITKKSDYLFRFIEKKPKSCVCSKSFRTQFLFIILQQNFYFLIFYIFFMQTGKVKFFNESKGFGFIVDDNSGEEIFVHVTGLSGLTIRENDSVSFDVQEGKRGLNAVNVKKA